MPDHTIMRILFADDTLDTRQLYAMIFRMKGHEATVVENGELARQAVEQQLFDVIVLDIEMPGADGLTATREIRRMRHGESVPIILLTAYDYRQSTALEAGADLLVRKPILAQDLLQKIGEAIQRKQA